MRGKKPYQILWLICTLALAGLATGVRLWQESTVFEGDFGLPVRGATASVAMVCVLVMAAAVLCILAARQPIVRPPRAQVRGRRWAMSFFATGDLVFLALMWFSAFSALAAVPMLFGQGRALWKAYQVALAMKTWQGGDNGVLSMVTAVLALLAFFGLLQIGRDGYHPGRRSRGGFWAALPACAGCGWLLNTYRNCAADPVLWDYVPLLLAVIAGMLMYTDWAGMSCAAARPRRTLWLAGMTVVCSWVALASSPDTGTAMLLISQSAAALAALWRLPINLQNPPKVGWEGNLDTCSIQDAEPQVEPQDQQTPFTQPEPQPRVEEDWSWSREESQAMNCTGENKEEDTHV